MGLKPLQKNASRGNSMLPPQLLKFMGHAGIGSLASFLNEIAIATAPPDSWKTAKIIPLYKGKVMHCSLKTTEALPLPHPCRRFSWLS